MAVKGLTKRDVQPLSLTKHPYVGQRGKSIDCSESINVSKQLGFLFGLGVVLFCFVVVWLFGLFVSLGFFFFFFFFFFGGGGGFLSFFSLRAQSAW